MAEGVKNDVASVDVVPQPVVTPMDAPLTFARFQAREFLNCVLSRTIVRILAKDRQKIVHRLPDGRLTSRDLSEFSFKGWGRKNAERAGHFVRSLLGLCG